jgi:hypothetical protein
MKQIVKIMVVGLICFLFSIRMNAQDVIFLRDGTEIAAIVQRIGSTDIDYKKFNNQQGPVYSIPKSQVFLIKYRNGDKDIFNEPVAPAPAPAPAAPVPANPPAAPAPATPAPASTPPPVAQAVSASPPVAAKPAASASTNTGVRRRLTLNAAYGIGGNYGAGAGMETVVPPLAASVEYPLKDGLLQGKATIGAGAYIGISGSKLSMSGYGMDIDEGYIHFLIGARGIFHYRFIDQLDTYGGVMLGYYTVTGTSSSESSSVLATASASTFAFSAFAGARYFFSPKLGAFAEVSTGGIASLEIGLTVNFASQSIFKIIPTQEQ